MELICCENNCIIQFSQIKKSLKINKPCPKCININLKKFKPIKNQLCLSNISNEFGRCVCGRRPIDVVMAHILKIMINEGIDINPQTLRNGPIPLVTPLTSQEMPHLNKNSLIILHPKLNKETAEKIINEVEEVKGVLKGSPNDVIGILDINDKLNEYELLSGCDIRCDILKTQSGKIAINKKQHLVHLEFSASTENKILKLDNYFKSKHLNQENLHKINLLDATCGCGSLGIYSLKYGFGNVTFNDINKSATEITAMNLEANGFKTNLVNDNNNNNNKNNDNSKNNNDDNKDNDKNKNNNDDNKDNDKNKNNNNDNNKNNKKRNDINEENNENRYVNNTNNHINNENILNTPNIINSKLDKDMIAYGNNFKVYNLSIEEFAEKTNTRFDFCIIDSFPQVDNEYFKKIGDKIAKNVIII
jgi:16S rRNA G966 N2-methylase RsmD